MTMLSVTLCPVSAFPERVILSVTALFAPDIVVTIDNNGFFIDGEGKSDIVCGRESLCQLRSFVELRAPFTVTSAVILAAVDEGVQFRLILNGEKVLSHWFIPYFLLLATC
jgi:hypothetical protein